MLVFALTWPLQIIDALGSHGMLPIRVSILLQLLFVAYMPTVAALIITALTSGRTGVRTLLQKALIWRVAFHWYAVAIFGFALICGSAIILGNAVSNEPSVPLLGPDAAQLSGWQLIIMIPVLFLLTTVVNGEELAWRGFALPRLQTRWNALTSSIILGIIWAVFHLPLFFTLTGSSIDSLSILSRSIQLIGASVIFTWLYNHTHGSVLLAYLLHGSVNTWTRVFPIDQAPALAGWMMTGLVCLIAIILVMVSGAEHLRRRGQRMQHPKEIAG
jgi:membrane protease YdiL (CAAX protease family)